MCVNSADNTLSAPQTAPLNLSTSNAKSAPVQRYLTNNRGQTSDAPLDEYPVSNASSSCMRKPPIQQAPAATSRRPKRRRASLQPHKKARRRAPTGCTTEEIAEFFKYKIPSASSSTQSSSGKCISYQCLNLTQEGDGCPYETTILSNIKKHIRSVHWKERPYPCNWCDFAGDQQSTLERHLIVHTKKKRYQCDICDRPFTQSNDLVRHKTSKGHLAKVVSAAKAQKNIRPPTPELDVVN